MYTRMSIISMYMLLTRPLVRSPHSCSAMVCTLYQSNVTAVHGYAKLWNWNHTLWNMCCRNIEYMRALSVCLCFLLALGTFSAHLLSDGVYTLPVKCEGYRNAEPMNWNCHIEHMKYCDYYLHVCVSYWLFICSPHTCSAMMCKFCQSNVRGVEILSQWTRTVNRKMCIAEIFSMCK